MYVWVCVCESVSASVCAHVCACVCMCVCPYFAMRKTPAPPLYPSEKVRTKKEKFHVCSQGVGSAEFRRAEMGCVDTR